MPPRRSEIRSFPLQKRSTSLPGLIGDGPSRIGPLGPGVVPLLYRQAAFEIRKIFQRVYCSIGTPSYI